LAKTREFRSKKSFEAEAITRGMVASFLEARGFSQVRDVRKSFGKTEQQIVHAWSPTLGEVAMHVRICWNREPGSGRQKRYSAVQLLSKIKDGDWVGSLNAKVDRDRRRGVTHALIVQREGDRLADAVLIPIDQIVDVWDAQRVLSEKLIKAGRFARKQGNHAMNGSSPTLWLHDENAPEIRASIMQWPGVIDLRNISKSAPDVPTEVLTDTRVSRDTAPGSNDFIGDRRGLVRNVDPPSDYIARLAYNSKRWWQPTRAAEALESADSYRSQFGFGHEDWLFRNEWLLDGWRYGFVQGVNKSRKRLLREARPFNLRLFTMPAPGDRRAVAQIREVECLTDELAQDAVRAYELHGWLAAMRSEVAASGGRAKALDKNEFAPFILNLRFRLENVHWLDAGAPLQAGDPIQKIKRYSLCEVPGAMESALPAWRGRAGATKGLSTDERARFVKGGWTTYSPEHARMQELLIKQLRDRYPGAKIECERDFVDVAMRTECEIVLYEVKSDLNPLSVVRQALGQVLEYAFHPRRKHDLPVRLVIVGRRPLEGSDLQYFERLKHRFDLPMTYWTVPV
jgi:hypothetical protein